MSRDKQIIEIKECIDAVYGADCAYFNVDGFAIANEIYNKGYRKASEIFEEIEEQMNAIYKSVQYGCYSYMRYGNIGTDSPDAQRQLGKLEGVKHLGNAIAELKKKYTEGK